MKVVPVISACVFALGTSYAVAQSHGHGDMKGTQNHQGCPSAATSAPDTHSCGPTKTSASNQQSSHQASGVVKKNDAAKGSVTIAHGAVKDLNWPAMTMTFKVKDKGLMDQLRIDKKVDFSFVQEGNDYVITAAR